MEMGIKMVGCGSTWGVVNVWCGLRMVWSTVQAYCRDGECECATRVVMEYGYGPDLDLHTNI